MSLWETLWPGWKTSPRKGTLEENVRLYLLILNLKTIFSLEADGKSIKMDEKQGILYFI